MNFLYLHTKFWYLGWWHITLLVFILQELSFLSHVAGRFWLEAPSPRQGSAPRGGFMSFICSELAITARSASLQGYRLWQIALRSRQHCQRETEYPVLWLGFSRKRYLSKRVKKDREGPKKIRLQK